MAFAACASINTWLLAPDATITSAPKLIAAGSEATDSELTGPEVDSADDNVVVVAGITGVAAGNANTGVAELTGIDVAPALIALEVVNTCIHEPEINATVAPDEIGAGAGLIGSDVTAPPVDSAAESAADVPLS